MRFRFRRTFDMEKFQKILFCTDGSKCMTVSFPNPVHEAAETVKNSRKSSQNRKIRENSFKKRRAVTRREEKIQGDTRDVKK